MDQNEFFGLYKTVWVFIHSEQLMRERVFAEKPAKLETKVAEAKAAKSALEAMAAFGKQHTTPTPVQGQLLDAPTQPKGGY